MGLGRVSAPRAAFLTSFSAEPRAQRVVAGRWVHIPGPACGVASGDTAAPHSVLPLQPHRPRALGFGDVAHRAPLSPGRAEPETASRVPGILKCWLHGHTWFHGSGRKTARAGVGLWGIRVQNTPAAPSSRRPLSLTAAHAPPRRSLEAEAAAAGGGELGAQLRFISTKQPWDRQPHRLLPRGVWSVPLPSLAEETCRVNSCPGCWRGGRSGPQVAPSLGL